MLKIKTKNKKEMLMVLSRLSGANTLYKKIGILSWQIFHLQCGSLLRITKLEHVKVKDGVYEGQYSGDLISAFRVLSVVSQY